MTTDMDMPVFLLVVDLALALCLPTCQFKITKNTPSHDGIQTTATCCYGELHPLTQENGMHLACGVLKFTFFCPDTALSVSLLIL